MDENKTNCDECCNNINGICYGVTAKLSNDIKDFDEDSDEDFDNCDMKQNRIHDIVVKQMDLGYLVKVGCQTLCLETKEKLIELFTVYLNNPKLTIDRFYKNKILDNKKIRVRIGIVGYSLNDVNQFLKLSLMLPFNTFRKINNRYEGEVNGEILILIPLTKPEHCGSHIFNKIVETHRARENKNFEEIIKTCNTLLNPENIN